MRILILNVVCGTGSTGRLCARCASEFRRAGHETVVAYGRGRVPPGDAAGTYRIGGRLNAPAHALRARLSDSAGFGSAAATRRFLRWADRFNPDVLWLHNLHGYYLHVGLLFQWIRNRDHMETRWMLHDCWPFTGHCAHFAAARCRKWETGCWRCPELGRYPRSWGFDGSARNFARKRACFTGVPRMRLLVPSRWMAERVSRSFLAEYPCTVRPHIVDRRVFRPGLPRAVGVRGKLGLGERFFLLGVSSQWNDRKGLDDLLTLAGMLDRRFALVLVGLTPGQRRRMPGNVLALPPVRNPAELAAFYGAADVFLNLSREESFGLTVLEALSCGTPAVVYEGTACAEVALANGGIVVEQTVDAVREAIERLARQRTAGGVT